MNLDDKLCLCFHVTKRKVVNYIRIHEPRRASQISECGGAGTGCGWCIPILQHLFEESLGTTTGSVDDRSIVDLSAEEYEQLRAKYVRSGKGKPPAGATPLPDSH